MSYVESGPLSGLPRFVPPSFDELRAEQARVQAGKFQGRLLSGYNGDIFPGHTFKEGCAVADFMRPYAAGDTVSLETVLDGMSERAGRQIHWVDMQAGRSLAQRQYMLDPARRERVAATAVDLFDYGLEGLDEEEIAFVKEVANGPKPNVIIADAQEVVLDRPGDVITCEEGIQYLDDPLRAIANWYNQLAAGGFLFISRGGDWASMVGYDFSSIPYGLREDQSPIADMLDELAAAGVPFEATKTSDWASGHRPLLNPGEFRSLVIQKVSGTQMMVNTTPSFINSSYSDHKNPLYRMADPGDPTPPVQIMRTPS